MRFILAILLIALLSALATYYLPWWSLAVVAFIVGWLIRLRTGHAFLAGFIGIFLLWLVIGLWRDIPNAHILLNRMADVILHTKNGALYIVLASVIGGMVGGLAAWSGGQMRRMLA